jgi:hypothetical protein
VSTVLALELGLCLCFALALGAGRLPGKLKISLGLDNRHRQSVRQIEIDDRCILYVVCYDYECECECMCTTRKGLKTDIRRRGRGCQVRWVPCVGVGKKNKGQRRLVIGLI